MRLGAYFVCSAALVRWLFPLILLGGMNCAKAQELKEPIKLPSGVYPYKLVSRVSPSYPSAAKQAHVEGMVFLRATIGRDGKVQHLEVIDGPPMLADAAMAAVKHWVYAPYLVDGQPRAVQTVIQVNFSFSDSPLEVAQEPRIQEYPRISMVSHLLTMVDPTKTTQSHPPGIVSLDLLINSKGDVEEVFPVRGPDVLIAVAQNAVRQWKYTPDVIKGQPSAVITRVTFDFQ